MSDRPPSSRRGAESARSGQHPAVKAYRAKLDSITEKADASMSKLDRTLEEFLNDLQTPAPVKT